MTRPMINRSNTTSTIVFDGPAALSFEERNSREDHNFICASNKALSAVDMLPPLVDDLCLLGKGIEMYSAQYDEYVLVVPAVLFISRDNPRHSQLVMHKDTCSSFYYRKCLIPRPSNPNSRKKDNLIHLNHFIHEGHPHRTWEFLDQFSKASTDSALYKKSRALSYANNGSEEFLRLKSFDGTLDALIEILHYVPLDVMRYLTTVLMKSSLLNLPQKEAVQKFLTDYRICKAYSRAFRNQMIYSGSFVGRDFKQLMLALPLGLRVIL